MKQLAEVVDAKRQQMIQVQKDIAALERALSLLGSTGLMPAAAGNGASLVGEKSERPANAKKKPRRKKLIPGKINVPDAAEHVIRELGRPLHVKELAERMKSLGIWPAPAAVAAALMRYSDAGRRFQLAAPLTFALLETSED